MSNQPGNNFKPSSSNVPVNNNNQRPPLIHPHPPTSSNPRIPNATFQPNRNQGNRPPNAVYNTNHPNQNNRPPNAPFNTGHPINNNNFKQGNHHAAPAHHSHPNHQNRNQDSQQNAANAASENLFDFSLFESINYPFCVDHSKYENIAKIGQGTFGEVFKARCKRTNEFVALKQILTDNEKEGFPITALREIKILQLLNHENIVKLIETCTSKATAANKFRSKIYLVFEFCEHDLAGLLSNKQIKFTLGEQKRIMQQLLNGLYYIHQNCILHRDMKTANILVTKEGKLKLADFGLARAVAQQQHHEKYTNRVVTLWYRPPELLLGERCYNKAIDMWGAGCIMAELWTREPILKGDSEQKQLELIQSYCGSINSENLPGVEKLDLFIKMNLRRDCKRKLKERLGNFVKDAYGLDLIDKLLTLDPKKRIDSDEALDHDFFWSDPLPTDLKLDKINQSMFEFTAATYNRAQFRHANNNRPVLNDQHFDRVY